MTAPVPTPSSMTAISAGLAMQDASEEARASELCTKAPAVRGLRRKALNISSRSMPEAYGEQVGAMAVARVAISGVISTFPPPPFELAPGSILMRLRANPPGWP